MIYVVSSSDLARAGYASNPSAALDHYLLHGVNEGRATTTFDPLIYVASNLDLAQAGYASNSTASVDHYLRFGVTEGRAIASFDAVRYVEANLDLLRAGYAANPGAALRHWLEHGIFERRRSNNDGDDQLALLPGDRASGGTGDDQFFVAAPIRPLQAVLIVGQGSSVVPGSAAVSRNPSTKCISRTVGK